MTKQFKKAQRSLNKMKKTGSESKIAIAQKVLDNAIEEKDASDAMSPRTREKNSSPEVDVDEAEKWMMQDDGQETGAADGVHAG